MPQKCQEALSLINFHFISQIVILFHTDSIKLRKTLYLQRMCAVFFTLVKNEKYLLAKKFDKNTFFQIICSRCSFYIELCGGVAESGLRRRS